MVFLPEGVWGETATTALGFLSLQLSTGLEAKEGPGCARLLLSCHRSWSETVFCVDCETIQFLVCAGEDSV